ncbi:MAG: major capsid protein P2 [Colwellia sp.]
MALNTFAPYSRNMRSAEGIAWNETGHIEIKGGSTLHMIELQTNITDASKIKRVWLEIGGTPIVQFTGKQLAMLDAFKGLPAVAGKFVIPFSDLIYRSREGVTSGKLPTYASEEIYLYIELGDGTGSISVKGRYWMTDGERRIFTPKTYSTTFDASASGVNDFIWKNGNATRRVRRIHFKSESINKIKVFRDSRLIHEIEKTTNKEDLARYGDLTPQAGYFHFDPTLFGFGWDGLFSTHGGELKFELDMAVAESVPMFVEMLEQTAPLQVS